MNNRLKNPVVWVPVALALAFVGGLWTGGAIFSAKDGATGGTDKFNTVLQLISSQYVDEINPDSLVEQTLPDLLSHLDPHTVYIPASDLQATNDELEGSFSGVGISFQLVNDTITVVEVISGGPAEKVGLLAGDRIVTINDSVCASRKWTEEDVRRNLRGIKGSEVKVGIKRSTAPKLLEYKIVRGDIPVTSIDAAYMLAPKTGYIKVNKFGTNTFSEFLNAAIQLKSEGAEGYIIDLRGNGGGYMEPAVLMANEFLPRGAGIVSTRGRLAANNSAVGADGSGSLQEAQVTVLIDEFSASASEIFAGAIQDNDRGLVVGRRSFGKGLVQNQIVLPDSSALRLTVARYYTPSGRCIQKTYTPGSLMQYSNEILERYNHGEYYSADSVRLDKSLIFHTNTGREVFGGGGIMPDVFVAADTSGVTSWYLQAANAGMLQKFAFTYCDNNRQRLAKAKNVEELLRQLPSDDALLEEFVDYCSANNIPARWYYINISSKLIVNHLKALIARDLLDVSAFYRIYNQDDNVILRALNEIKSGKAAPPLLPQKNNMAMKKEDIRRSIRTRKALLNDEERRVAAASVFDRLEQTAAFMLAERVLMYHSLPDELSTLAFLDKWAGRKRFFLPRVNGVNLDILPYNRSTLRLGAFQIEEPEGADTVSIDEVDLVVVPGVAYDRQGNRLGRGKGYYDRLLAETHATKVGVCYDFQLVDSIDTEEHDVAMDVVIAGNTTIMIRR